MKNIDFKLIETFSTCPVGRYCECCIIKVIRDMTSMEKVYFFEKLSNVLRDELTNRFESCINRNHP